MYGSILFLILFCSLGCTEEVLSPVPKIPINDLLTSPEQISLEGRQLYITTHLWRDFQPSCPPDGKPLYASVHLKSIEQEKMPESISIDYFWIVYNDQTWGTKLEGDDASVGNSISKGSFEGPKWGPDIYVDVIVRVLINKKTHYLLRASHQYIDITC